MKKLALTSFLMFTSITYAYAGKGEHVHGMHHDKASAGGLPQLDPSSFTSQVFWLILIFTAIYLFFSRKSLPDIASVVENRAERIKNDLDSAALLKKEVEELQASYEENLNKTREEAALIFKKVEDDIKSKSDKYNKDFQEYSMNKIIELEKNIEQARKNAMDEMSDVAADVAINAAEKIIGVRADVKSVKNVVDSLNKKAA